MTDQSSTVFIAQTFINLPHILYRKLGPIQADCVIALAHAYLEKVGKDAIEVEEKPARIDGLEQEIIDNVRIRFPFLTMHFEYPGFINLSLHDGRSVQCGSQTDGWWLQFSSPDEPMELMDDSEYAPDEERDPDQLAWSLVSILLRCPWRDEIFAGPRPPEG